MARQPENYSHNNQLSSVAEPLISAVSAGSKETIRKLSFRNTGATTRTVTVYIVENSGTPAITNELTQKAIPGGKEWNVVLVQGEVLDEGMSLQAKQDAGTDVNSNCSGTKIT